MNKDEIEADILHELFNSPLSEARGKYEFPVQREGESREAFLKRFQEYNRQYWAKAEEKYRTGKLP